MSKRKKLIWAGSAAVLVLAAFIVVSRGFYPIAFVNGKAISTRSFESNFAAVSVYYENYLKTYDPERKSDILSSEDIGADVLTQMVESILIHKAITKEEADLDVLVEERLGSAEGGKNFREAAEKLYGMSFDAFKRRMLVPQIEKDILTGRLYLRGLKYEDFIKDLKAGSRVIILSKRFVWNGERILPQ